MDNAPKPKYVTVELATDDADWLLRRMAELVSDSDVNTQPRAAAVERALRNAGVE